jgi:protein-tyrosine phosphatase
MGDSADMDAWWIEEPFLLGGSNPSDDDLVQLRRRGFGVIFSLLDERRQQPRYDPELAAGLGFVRHNIPVGDFEAPTAGQLARFVELAEAVPGGVGALVHCQGGLGRTGTFAAAWLVSRGLAVREAVERVRLARPGAVETPEQECSLHRFAASRGGTPPQTV